MKKLLFVTFIALFFTGCNINQSKTNNQQIIQEQNTLETGNAITKQTLPENSNSGLGQNDYFNDTELGIKFRYRSEEFKGKLKKENNKISYYSPELSEPFFITVFTKTSNQSIEDAILNIVKDQGKDPNNCKVVKFGEHWLSNPKYNEYIIDLSDTKISYSKEELEEIRLGAEEGKKDGGPVDEEWMKKVIYNRRLIEKCSKYADPLGLGTSTSLPSQFIYDNKSKFVFLPGSFDPSFYDYDSIEFLY